MKKDIMKDIDNIEIPLDLDNVINDAVNEGYKSRKKYNNKFKKYVMAAGIIIGVMGLSITFSDNVIASVKLAMFNIEDFLGINKDLDDYKTVVNKTITKNGITVQLNEVILDKDQIIVSTTAKSDEKLPGPLGIDLFGSVYINGRRVSDGSGGSSKKIDDYTEEAVISYDLTKELDSGKLDIEIKYDEAHYIYENDKEKFIKGPWKFEFVTSEDNLAKNTDVIKLDNKFELDDGQKIQLNEYRSNDVGQKIYFSIEDKVKPYDIVLKGHDDLGNEVEFYCYKQRKREGAMKNSGGISKDTKTLTLTPYAVAYPEESGRMSNDFEKCGEEFNINIS